MYHRREARIGFVVTGGDAAELLDLAEEALDQMTPLVDLDVAGDCGDPVGFWRDHGNGSPIGQVGTDDVAIKSLVREKGAEIEIRQKRSNAHGVVLLTGQQGEPKMWKTSRPASPCLIGIADFEPDVWLRDVIRERDVGNDVPSRHPSGSSNEQPAPVTVEAVYANQLDRRAIAQGELSV